jgi:hypothetical protein
MRAAWQLGRGWGVRRVDWHKLALAALLAALWWPFTLARA